MGLGKTLQMISFIDVFLRHTEAKTVSGKKKAWTQNKESLWGALTETHLVT